MAICVLCSQTDKTVRLTKCAGCFKPICEGCGLRKYGKAFCGQECSAVFFFGTDPDEDEKKPA